MEDGGRRFNPRESERKQAVLPPFKQRQDLRDNRNPKSITLSPELKDKKRRKISFVIERTSNHHGTEAKRLDIHRSRNNHNFSTRSLDVVPALQNAKHVRRPYKRTEGRGRITQNTPVFRSQFRSRVEGEIGQVKGTGNIKTFYSERNRHVF